MGGVSQVVATNRREKLVEAALTQNKDWGKRYGALAKALESADPSVVKRAQNAFMVMENQRQIMEAVKADPKLEATFSANLGALVPRVIDLVRIFYPNLIINELMDIQPLDRQNGEIFIVKPVYTNSAAGVSAGQQVFRNVTDGTYASESVSSSVGTGDGSTLTFGISLTPVPVRPSTVRVVAGNITGVDNGSGTITGAGISGTINYATGALSVTFTAAPAVGTAISASFRYDSENAPTNIRQLEIQLLMQPIQAQPHPLNVKWSTQAQLAASAHLNLDIPDVLTNLVASFIKQERDITAINAIIAAATADVNLNFDAAPPSNYSKLAKYAEIQTKLNYAESVIQLTQGRGGVSWVLCGNNAADVWRNAAGFEPVKVVAPIGPHKIGTLRDGTVAVIKVPTMNVNTYVVGFKGYVVGDSAAIMAEWVPLYATPVFQSFDLNNYQGMMSLYDLFINNAGYYRKGTISNYSA